MTASPTAQNRPRPRAARRLCVAIALSSLALSGCEREQAVASVQPSPCRVERFESADFTVCTAARSERLQLHAAARGERAKRGFTELGLPETKVAFAMNAGMFDEDGRPIGLAIVDGREVHTINRRDGGGNFHLKPNGIFLVREDGGAEVIETDRFKPAPDIRIATQSGPMLVVDGRLHPRFEHDGESRQMRNGVGVSRDGQALFVMTRDPVSLGKLGRFYRDVLKTPNALYFDGSVSSLWVPAEGRMDDFTALGPIIVARR